MKFEIVVPTFIKNWIMGVTRQWKKPRALQSEKNQQFKTNQIWNTEYRHQYRVNKPLPDTNCIKSNILRYVVHENIWHSYSHLICERSALKNIRNGRTRHAYVHYLCILYIYMTCNVGRVLLYNFSLIMNFNNVIINNSIQNWKIWNNDFNDFNRLQYILEFFQCVTPLSICTESL